MWPSFGNS